MDDYRLANRIRSFRKLKGRTQVEFAAQLGISLAMLGAIERGTRRPSAEMLQAIVAALNIRMEELTQPGPNEVNV
jgi:transcriptional regulator with XRE-family HTH domain